MMPRECAIEIMVLNPDPAVHHGRKGVHENLWIKERFGKDNYLSIGVMLEQGTSELKFYFFEDCDKKPYPKFYSSLKELQEDLPPEKKDIFDRTHKVYLMGHGDDKSRYGFGNYHAHDDFSHGHRPDDTEQIYGDKFDELIQDILENVHAQNGEIGITLEVCHADNLVTAEKVGYTKSFLEGLSAEYPRVTFSGTGPWSDSKVLQESLATDSRASGGFPVLNAPITSMGGGIWKHGNTVIFHHDGNQIVVKKSPFASTETAKKLKMNTVEYAREILNQQTELSSEEKEAILTRICANRKITEIKDLEHEPDFPRQTGSANEKITQLEENEKTIIKQEQDRYLQRVLTILSQEKYSDRDVLMIALGLNHPFIFNGHDDILQKVLANENLLKLVMVSCGKVLMGSPNNDTVIDLLVKRGIDINSADEKSMTALHYAANNFYVYREEPLNLVKKLLDCGANVEAVDKTGRTPLMLATEQSRKETVMGGESLLQLLQLKSQMDKAAIPGVSIATMKSDGSIVPTVLGETGTDKTAAKVTEKTVFGAASLSKPIFSFLVLKLIEDNKSGKAKDKLGEFIHLPAGQEFNLDTPLHTIFPGIFALFDKKDKNKVELLTARIVLSHRTGLPDVHHDDTKPPPFWFEPGLHYGYSGPGIACLQKVIEAVTGKDIEALAKEYIFSESAFDMQHSTFQHDKSKPPQAANGLYTTPTDYLKFIKGWMADQAELLQEAFQPGVEDLTMQQSFLPEHWGIKDVHVDDEDKKHVSWGLGWGLQLDDKGEVTTAYHSGDMGEWRAWVAINVKDKSAVVFFTNSHNGHILAETIMPESIQLNHAFNFFFSTYGYARNLDEIAKKEGDESKNGLREGCLTAKVEHTSTTAKIMSSEVGKLSSESTAKPSEDLQHDQEKRGEIEGSPKVESQVADQEEKKEPSHKSQKPYLSH